MGNTSRPATVLSSCLYSTMVPVAAQSLANVIKTGPNVNLWFVKIGPVWFLPFQPRVLLLDHALIQLLEQRRRLSQRLPRRQLDCLDCHNRAVQKWQVDYFKRRKSR